MFYSHNEATMLRNIETGQFHVAKIEDNPEYISLIKSYPSSWHNHIQQAFRFGCTEMINELTLKVKVTVL